VVDAWICAVLAGSVISMPNCGRLARPPDLPDA
jgi:hypothetical protein